MIDSDTKVLLVENDPIFVVKLQIMLKELGVGETVTLSYAEEANLVIKNFKPTLIISDILLDGKKTGIDVAELAIQEDIPIILITMLKDARVYSDAMDLGNGKVSYLIKPFHQYTLKSVIELLICNKQLSDSTEKALFIRGHHNEKLRLSYNDIVWIEVDRNYSTIHTKSSKYSLKKSLLNLIEDLKDDRFIRVHNRYAVNIHYVKSISLNSVRTSIEELPLGRLYKKNLKTQMLQLK